MRIIGGKGSHAHIAQWVMQRCPLLKLDSPYSAIGLADDKFNLLAGVVYDNFVAPNIEVHTAADRHSWTRHFLGEAFRYPFLQLGVGRLTARIHAHNGASRTFVERLGFKLEGIVRECLSDQADMYIYGMLKRECRWLEVGLG